jgi:signal peptidase II
VVDWIQLPHWPVFNLADSAIVCGGVLAVLLATRGIHLDGSHDGGLLTASGGSGDGGEGDGGEDSGGSGEAEGSGRSEESGGPEGSGRSGAGDAGP